MKLLADLMMRPKRAERRRYINKAGKINVALHMGRLAPSRSFLSENTTWTDNGEAGCGFYRPIDLLAESRGLEAWLCLNQTPEHADRSIEIADLPPKQLHSIRCSRIRVAVRRRCAPATDIQHLDAAKTDRMPLDRSELLGIALRLAGLRASFSFDDWDVEARSCARNSKLLGTSHESSFLLDRTYLHLHTVRLPPNSIATNTSLFLPRDPSNSATSKAGASPSVSSCRPRVADRPAAASFNKTPA